MLEAKICEAGPGDKRPNPLSVSQAIKDLQQRNSVQVVPKRAATETPFYAPRTITIADPGFQALLLKRLHLYLLHKELAGQNLFCADVLERLLDTALERSGTALFRSRFPKQHLPAQRPLDFVIEIAGVLWGGEAKNFREWLYPESWEIWAAISKCCELDAVPVLVTRKLPYVSFVFFGKAGIAGYQTHFQFFHPVVEPELARVKAVDGLGYKDIRCSLEPDGNIIRFFQNTLPKIGLQFRRRFEINKELLRHFADDAGLANRKLNPATRRKTFSEAWKAIVGGQPVDDLLL